MKKIRQNQKNITKPIKKKNYKESWREYYRNIFEDEKIKKRNYGNIRNKIMSDLINIKRKKEYMRNCFYKRKRS